MTCIWSEAARIGRIVPLLLALAAAPNVYGQDTLAAPEEPVEPVESPTEFTTVDTVLEVEAAGGMVRVDIDKMSGDIVRMGENVVIEPGQVVQGDAVVIGGNMDIYGTVKGDAVVVGGSLHLFPEARVEREAVCIGGSLTREEGAYVGDEEVSVDIGLNRIPFMASQPCFNGPCFWTGRVAAVIINIFVLIFGFFVVLIFTELFSGPTERVAERVQKDYLRSGLAGFLSFILTIPVLVVLAISVIGLLLYPVMFVIMSVAPLWAWAAVALVLGRGLFAGILPNVKARWARATIGLVLLWIPLAVGDFIADFGGPLAFVGYTLLIATLVVYFVAFLVGVGAVLMSRGGRRGLAPEGVVPDEGVAAGGPPAEPPSDPSPPEFPEAK